MRALPRGLHTQRNGRPLSWFPEWTDLPRPGQARPRCGPLAGQDVSAGVRRRISARSPPRGREKTDDDSDDHGRVGGSRACHHPPLRRAGHEARIAGARHRTARSGRRGSPRAGRRGLRAARRRRGPGRRRGRRRPARARGRADRHLDQRRDGDDLRAVLGDHAGRVPPADRGQLSGLRLRHHGGAQTHAAARPWRHRADQLGAGVPVDPAPVGLLRRQARHHRLHGTRCGPS